MSGWRQAGALLLSGFVAGSAGYLTAPVSAARAPSSAPSAKAPAPVAPAPVPPSAPATTLGSPNRPDDSAALAKCQARLKACGELHRVAVVQDQGAAEPSNGAPHGYRLADIHAVLKKVAAQCPDLRTSKVVADCSEYPCLVWYPADPMFEHDKTLLDCSAWPFDRGHGTAGFVMSAAEAPDGTLKPYVLYVVAPERTDQTRLMWRMRHDAPKVVATWARAGL